MDAITYARAFADVSFWTACIALVACIAGAVVVWMER